MKVHQSQHPTKLHTFSIKSNLINSLIVSCDATYIHNYQYPGICPLTTITGCTNAAISAPFTVFIGQEHSPHFKSIHKNISEHHSQHFALFCQHVNFFLKAQYGKRNLCCLIFFPSCLAQILSLNFPSLHSPFHIFVLLFVLLSACNQIWLNLFKLI